MQNKYINKTLTNSKKTQTLDKQGTDRNVGPLFIFIKADKCMKNIDKMHIFMYNIGNSFDRFVVFVIYSYYKIGGIVRWILN